MTPPRALGLLLLLALPACLEIDQTIVLGADGSGRQTVRMSLRESTIAELQKASAAAQLGAAADPTAVFDQKLVEPELRAAGLTLVSHQTKRTPGRRTVDLEATFPDFATLQKSPLCGSTAEWELAKGPKEGTARLTFYPQGKAAWTEARAKAEQMQGAADAVATSFFQKRQQQLAGLSIQVRLQVPGDVLVWTKNMVKTGDREVTATITAEQIQTPEDLVRRLAPRFEVIFAAAGTKLPLQ
ncbi:MAG: hypothetical protein FJ265_03815 [Planctomycetes bacterium]|nr:hypothetical protein [Planctomycetota bacterium]